LPKGSLAIQPFPRAFHEGGAGVAPHDADGHAAEPAGLVESHGDGQRLLPRATGRAPDAQSARPAEVPWRYLPDQCLDLFRLPPEVGLRNGEAVPQLRPDFGSVRVVL